MAGPSTSQPQADSADGAANTPSEAARAGRGVLSIAGAKMYFMVAGAAIEFGLPRLFDSEVLYGAWGSVVAAVSPVNAVLITGTIQAVSRYTAHAPESAASIQRAGFRMHLLVGLPLALLFIALSPVVADFLLDGAKTTPLMMAGGIVAGYAFYAVFVGRANGEKRFHKQAKLDVTMATLRAGGVLGLAAAGFGLYGALGGWLGATALILGVAAMVVGLPGRDASRFAMAPLVKFFAGVALYLILLNLLMVVDALLLKRLVTEWYLDRPEELARQWELLRDTKGFVASGLDTAGIASSLADAQVGYYRGVQNFARLPYQLIIAATFVIFPLVARATFHNDEAATRRYVSTTLRYSTLVVMGLAVVFAANPYEILDIPYKTAYAVQGQHALGALALGQVAFAIFAIVGTILNGAGMIREAAITAVVTLCIAVAANWFAIPLFVPEVGAGRAGDVLTACGVATASSMIVGAALGLVFLRIRLGATLSPVSAVRIIIAAAVAIACGRALSFTSPVLVLVESACVGIVFLLALFAVRELSIAEIKAIGNVLRKRS